MADPEEPPEVRGPRDLPELRVWLLDMWRGPFGQHAMTYPGVNRTDPRFSDLNFVFDPRLIANAQLWWVTPEMSRPFARAAETLPATTLTEELIPRHQVVFAYFAEPLRGPDVNNPGVEMIIRVLGWQAASLAAYPGVPHVGIAMYAEPSMEEWATMIPFFPAGRTDWRYGTDTETHTFPKWNPDATQRRLNSMAQDRRWLAALTLLSQQPVSETRDGSPTNRTKLRRLAKAGNYSTEVRVLDLHQTVRDARPQSAEGGSGREYSHRWVVGEDTGGFWRQVAYGPRHSLRRPQWILPYIAGPDDKPLVLKETVRKVRAPEPPPR